MAKLITVASRLPMTVRLSAPDQPDIEIPGTGNPDLQGDPKMTEGVDAKVFAAWLKANADSDMVRNRMIYPADEADGVEKPIPGETGFEPALERAAPQAQEAARE